MLTEYRQRFSDFSTELMREEYLFHAGRKESYETARIFSGYSDLFTREAGAGLRTALEATSPYRETERDAIRLLIAFAHDGYLESRVRELSQEIGDYEAGGTITWDGQTIGFHQSAAALSEVALCFRRFWCIPSGS